MIPSTDTIFAAYRTAARQYGQRPFLHVPAGDGHGGSREPFEVTYGDMLTRAWALADRYQAAGYGPGHRVALVLENRPRFFEQFLALNRVGASIVPLSAELRAQEFLYLAKHSDVSLVVALPEHHPRLAQMLAPISGMPQVIADHGDEFQPPTPDREVPAALRLSPDEAALLYTSGTTGKPKGCVLSNEYLLECGRWYVTLGGLCTFQSGRERLITPLPLNHSNALAWSFMGMVLSGGCLVQLDRFHPRDWWDTVRQSRATIIHYLGVMPAMLLKSAPTPDDDFGDQIKFGFGAGVDPRHHSAFERRFGFPLIEAWAMTETGSAVVMAANEEPRQVATRCFGQPTAQMECRIVDEGGVDVPLGTSGELLVRRRGEDPRRYFFSGYYRDPAATAQAWADRWFHSGDVVRADADGRFYFVDRLKNIVRRSGENIAAVEVEGALLRHPAVKACAVAAVPDEVRGEEVFACVVLEGDAIASDALAADVFEFSNTLLAYYKAPGYIAFTSELPVTGSQKIQRAELRRLAQRLLAENLVTDLTARKKRARSVTADESAT